MTFLEKNLILGLFFFSLPLLLTGQNENTGDSLVTIQCQLKSYENGTPVAYAHILNNGLNIGTISDSLGFFTIVMRRSDSLYISALGIKESYFSLPGFWPSNYFSGIIPVRQQIYMIDPVTVEGFGNYAQFRQKVISNNQTRKQSEKRLRILSV